MADNSEEANPASSSHLFKARQLLAMGKVVISEVIISSKLLICIGISLKLCCF